MAPPAVDRATEPLRSFGDALGFSNRALAGVLRGRVLHYFGETLRQAGVLVSGSLAVILGMVLVLGLVIGINSAYVAQSVGAPSAAGGISALADLREIIPYAFGYMMAAKVSTGYVAEIGTARISDEIDALEVMGVDSMLYVVSTRVLGVMLVLPFIYAIAVVVGFFGSYVAVVLQVGLASPGGFFELFWQFQSPADYVFSLTKAMAMSVFVVLVGCYYGYTVSGGPVDVGRATAQAMIINLVGVHFIGILGSQLFWGGDPRLSIGG